MATTDNSTTEDTHHTRQASSKVSKPIIELTSTSTGAGKTHLCYLLSVLAVLPALEYAGELRGRKGTVVVIDTDDRFDVERLDAVMREHIRNVPKPPPSRTDPASSPSADPVDKDKQDDYTLTDEQLDELVQQTLRHLHIFQPQSLQALVATLNHLETYLTNISAHCSADRQLDTIVLDSASSFYWQHRAEEDNLRLRRIEGTYDGSGSVEPPLYTQLLRALRKAQQRFNCNVVYTSQSNPPFKDNTGSAGRSFDSSTVRTNLRPLLPPSWFAYPTFRLLLQRTRVARFAVGMGAEDAWKDRDTRWEAVKGGRYSACTIDTNGVERKVFDFDINANGISIED